jgi:hypothetical protein
MARQKTGVYMGTTEVDQQKTAGEIIGQLVKAGASSVYMDYRGGKLTGIRWVMQVNGHDAVFDMPARVEALLKRIPNEAQATRVAWRQLLRWVQAQNAMIECGMAQAAEVFFAYHVPPGSSQTLFQIALGNQFKALPAPKAH